MTASLPSCSSASFVASIEPSASPSGFSWVTSRKRSWARSASATALQVTRASVVCRRAHRSACVMRTPRSTDGSYSKVSWGVRFSRSSPRRRRACSTPCAGRRARERPLAPPLGAEHADVDRRLAAGPATSDTGDRDEPDPGVLQLAHRLGRAPREPPRSTRAHPLTHRRYSSGQSSRRDDAPARPGRARTPGRPGSAPAAVEQLARPRACPRATHDEREARALPELVVVDLRHRGAEAPLELRLDRQQLLALALERAVLGEVQLGGEDADVAGAHGALPATRRARRRRRAAGVGSRSVRSISRVSYTSSTSPSLTSLKLSSRMPHSKPSCDLAGVVLEALELRDRRLVDDRAVAHDAHLARRGGRRRS